MKAVITFALAALFSTAAFAGNRVCHTEMRPVYCHDQHHSWQCGTRPVTVCRGGCAAPVETANLSVADQTMAQLAASPDFAGTTVFQAKVKAIAAETDSDVKFGMYADIVGMSDATQDDLAYFRGARTPDPKTIASVESNLSLNQAQAVEVINALTAALNGNGALE